MKSAGSGRPAADVNERQTLEKTTIIEPLRIKICQHNSHVKHSQAPDMPSSKTPAYFRERRLKFIFPARARRHLLSGFEQAEN
jgi:hypothetical protein